MRRTLFLILMFVLTACQPAAGSDQAATLAPLPTATPEVYTTLAPTPENEATAAAMLLNCTGEMGTELEASIAEGSGFETPEEALDNFEQHHNVFSESPTYAYTSSDQVNYLYFNAEGRKVQQINAHRFEWGLWIVVSADACHPLE